MTDMSEGKVWSRIRSALESEGAREEMHLALTSGKSEIVSAYLDALACRCGDAALGAASGLNDEGGKP